jgi:hypothetical protein
MSTIYSDDGKWMWTGTEWIPTQNQNDSLVSNIQVQDSVISGNINQNVGLEQVNIIGSSVNHNAVAGINISDSVVTGDVNVNITQNVDHNLIQYIMEEIGKLNLNMSQIRTELEKETRKPKVILSQNKEDISRLAEIVMSEERKSGGRLLDSTTYEQLSAISTAAAANSSTYFNTAFAETATNNDEWLTATKRRLKTVWWINNLHLYRTPESHQIMHDIVDDLISGRGDLRMLGLDPKSGAGKFINGHRFVKGRFLPWFNGIIARNSKKRKYDLEAQNDPNLPTWSELPRLQSEYKEKRKSLKEIWTKYLVDDPKIDTSPLNLWTLKRRM